MRDQNRSKQLNYLNDPAIIISASGMAENGRILHHLKNNIEDAENTVLFVGFQAENTLGRRILDGASPVKIFGEEYDVRAQVLPSTATARTRIRRSCWSGRSPSTGAACSRCSWCTASDVRVHLGGEAAGRRA